MVATEMMGEADRQLSFFMEERMSHYDIEQSLMLIRQEYWFIRTLRGGSHTDSERQKHYRKVAKLKLKLLLAGVDKRKLLDFLACCRNRCPASKQPFRGCPSAVDSLQGMGAL